MADDLDLGDGDLVLSAVEADLLAKFHARFNLPGIRLGIVIPVLADSLVVADELSGGGNELSAEALAREEVQSVEEVHEEAPASGHKVNELGRWMESLVVEDDDAEHYSSDEAERDEPEVAPRGQANRQAAASVHSAQAGDGPVPEALQPNQLGPRPLTHERSVRPASGALRAGPGAAARGAPAGLVSRRL
jgi:hypothetical protein